ncbi:MAG: ribosome-associated translation inhibitor RaiA [Bacteroidetes bacterium]|nr:ribosome-associated translation inhibitor RaiA [Bacteroidota bacterium]
MVIDFQSTNFKADRKLLDFISSKLAKLDHFHDRIVNATVYMKVDHVPDKNNKTLEIKINVADTQLFVTEHDRTFEAATDNALMALKNQLVKYKNRQVSS